MAGRPRKVHELYLGNLGLHPVTEKSFTTDGSNKGSLLYPEGVRTNQLMQGGYDRQRELMLKIQAPISEIVTGRVFTDRTSTIAGISPILGQYAGKQSYPDDWGLYWEYIFSRYYVPEVSYALRLKTNLIWSDNCISTTLSSYDEMKIQDLAPIFYFVI